MVGSHRINNIIPIAEVTRNHSLIEFHNDYATNEILSTSHKIDTLSKIDFHSLSVAVFYDFWVLIIVKFYNASLFLN